MSNNEPTPAPGGLRHLSFRWPSKKKSPELTHQNSDPGHGRGNKNSLATVSTVSVEETSTTVNSGDNRIRANTTSTPGAAMTIGDRRLVITTSSTNLQRLNNNNESSNSERPTGLERNASIDRMPADNNNMNNNQHPRRGESQDELKKNGINRSESDRQLIDNLKERLLQLDDEKSTLIQHYENVIQDLSNSHTCKEHLETIQSLHHQIEQFQQIIKQQASLIDQLRQSSSLTQNQQQQLLNSSSSSSSANNNSGTFRVPLPPALQKGNSKVFEDSNSSNSSSSASNNISATQVEKKPLIGLHILSNNMTLNTSVQPSWTVRETITRIKKKIMGDTTNYQLYLKTGKNSYQILDLDKTIDHYSKYLEDSKTVLEYGKPANYEVKGNRVVKRTPSLRKEKVTAAMFHQLIAQRDHNRLETYLTSDTRYDLDEFNEEQLCPIHAAFRSSDKKIAELFFNYYLRMGLDINKQDHHGWTPLHYAVSSCTGTDTDDEILLLLLEHPDVKVDVENQDGNTPLHYFCQRYVNPSCRDLGQKLINKAPTNINKKNKNGETPLHKAIFNSTVRLLMVKLLVANHCDVNLGNSSAETALHYAVRLRRKDLVKILLFSGADVTLKETRGGKTPNELAVESSQEEISEILDNVRDLNQWVVKHKLDEFFQQFLKEDLFLDTLAQVPPENIDSLLDALKIDAVGLRLRVKQALTELKVEMGNKIFEAKLQKLQKQKAVLGSTNQAQQKELVTDLSQFGNEEDWLIRHSDLEFTKELGTGASGKVFKGLYKDKKVAIKVFKAVDSKTLSEFKKEFHVMHTVRSPYLIRFFGAAVAPKVCMVMEYCSRGSLHDILKNDKHDITWDLAKQFVKEMFLAMDALHSCEPAVFHRDMKSLNLLVTKEWNIKMCDFGLARFNTSDNMNTMKKMCGTYHYLSPELFYGQNFTAKSDIFSCGIVVWECVYRVSNKKYQIPYQEYGIKMDFQIPYQVAEKGVRPSIPANSPTFWRELIRRCLAKDPEHRPTAKEVLQALDHASAEELTPSASI